MAEFKVMGVSVNYIGLSLDQELGTQGIPAEHSKPNNVFSHVKTLNKGL